MHALSCLCMFLLKIVSVSRLLILHNLYLSPSCNDHLFLLSRLSLHLFAPLVYTIVQAKSCSHDMRVILSLHVECSKIT